MRLHAGPLPALAPLAAHPDPWVSAACLPQQPRSLVWYLHRVQRPPASEVGSAKVVPTRWVFAAKYSPVDGSLVKLKSRLVAKGFVCRRGEHFTDTYAATMRAETMRLFLASAVAANDDVTEADVVKRAPADCLPQQPRSLVWYLHRVQRPPRAEFFFPWRRSQMKMNSDRHPRECGGARDSELEYETR